MHITEIQEVIKASPAIQIQSKITHLQRRAWNVLLANAYEELPDTDIHRISVEDLAQCLGYDSKDIDHLKDTLRALVDCTVKWNILRKDKKQEWGVAALLASAKIANGVCTYGFAPHLRHRLYNPRIYTKLNLRLQNQFTSRYAVILWEVCFDYFDIARNVGETPFISIEDFRELMGLDNDEYPEFKVLNRDVIKPAIEEINELTNFVVEIEHQRVRRRVSALKFRISRIKEIPALEPSKEETEPTQASLFVDVEDLPLIAVRLVQAGVSHKEARRIAEQEWNAVDPELLPEDTDDFVEYVEEKIGLARYTTDLRNSGGFIIHAIRENYQNPEYQEELRGEKEKEKAEMLASLRREMFEKRDALIRKAARANPELLEEASKKISSRFVRDMLMEYNTVLEAYTAGVMVAGELNSILADGACAELIAPIMAAYEADRKRIENS
ncbi:replication initiation protein [Candidatus Poribacteria bacterium]|nr:replication initiation protein [Candidatus Poribacteria bacterium]